MNMFIHSRNIRHQFEVVVVQNLANFCMFLAPKIILKRVPQIFGNAL